MLYNDQRHLSQCSTVRLSILTCGYRCPLGQSVQQSYKKGKAHTDYICLFKEAPKPCIYIYTEYTMLYTYIALYIPHAAQCLRALVNSIILFLTTARLLVVRIFVLRG